MISIDEATRDWQEMAAPVEPMNQTTRRYPRSMDEAFQPGGDGITHYPSTPLGHEVLRAVMAAILVGMCVALSWGLV